MCAASERRELALTTIELLREPARRRRAGRSRRRSARSGISTTDARRVPDSSGTLIAFVSSSSKTADWSMRVAQRLQRAAESGSGAAGGGAPLGRLDELAVLLEEQQLARLDRQHPAERPHGDLRRSRADRAASSCRRTGARETTDRRCARRAARPSAARARRISGPTACSASLRKARCRLDVDHADDPVGSTSGIASSETTPRKISTKSGSARDVDHELHRGCAHRPADHALLEGKAVGDHRVAACTDRPEPAVLEHERGDAGPAEPVVKGVERAVDRRRRRLRAAATAAEPPSHAITSRARSIGYRARGVDGEASALHPVRIGDSGRRA